jgi:hypothetical protein
MPELTDYSGPFNPDLKFEDFSKDFLLKLMWHWQWAWLHLGQAWFSVVQEEYGTDVANNLEHQSWMRMASRVNPRYAKMANIQLNTVLDSLKAAQLPLGNACTSGVFPPEFEIISPNHVIQTLPDCQTLRYMEKEAPERIPWLCHFNEKKLIEKYFINPKVKVTPLKLPPRKSPDEIACQWEYKIEE